MFLPVPYTDPQTSLGPEPQSHDVFYGPVEFNQLPDQQRLDEELNPEHRTKIADLYAITQNILQQTGGQSSVIELTHVRSDYIVTVHAMADKLPEDHPPCNQIRISSVKPGSLEAPLVYNIYTDRIRLQSHVEDSDPVKLGEQVLAGRELEIALEELDPIIKSFPLEHYVEHANQRVIRSGIKRAASVLACLSVVTALPVAALKAREDDIVYRQNITAQDLGLPAGRPAELGDKVHPKAIDLDPDPYDFYTLKGGAYYLDTADRFLKPKDDAEFTSDDGIRMVRLDVSGQCERIPLGGQFSPKEHQVLGWTPFMGVNGESLKKYVTLIIEGTQQSGYSLNVCSKIAPGVFDNDLSGVGDFPSQDTAEVLIDFVPRS